MELEAQLRNSRRRVAPLTLTLLRSASEDFFCAGADLEVISQGRAAELSTPSGGFAGLIDSDRRKPWIACVTGPVLAGGFEICLACDMIVASSDARFGLPEVKRGLFAAGGGAHRLGQWLPRAVTLELLATGDAIGAERAYALGLINRIVARSEVLEQALAIARAIAANAPRSVIETLSFARHARESTEPELRAMSAALAQELFASEDAAEGATAFLQKRTPRWTGR
jgi:enoyl-CoA hydratase/carnithine racemase